MNLNNSSKNETIVEYVVIRNSLNRREYDVVGLNFAADIVVEVDNSLEFDVAAELCEELNMQFNELVPA